MGDVKLYFKVVKTGDFIPEGSDGYSTEKTRTIEDLKTDIASFYDLEVTSVWLFRHKSEDGSILDNSKTVEGSGLENNDVVFIQDPELVRISCFEISQEKVVWAYRNETIRSVKAIGFPTQTTASTFSNGVKLNDDALVHSLVEKISLNIGDWSPSTPQTILPGLREGRYRLFNPTRNRWLTGPGDSTDLYAVHGTTGRYFDVELSSPGATSIRVSYLDNIGSWRYLNTNWWSLGGGSYDINITTYPRAWEVTSVNATTFRLSTGTWFLHLPNSYDLIRPILFGSIPLSDGSAYWNFVA